MPADDRADGRERGCQKRAHPWQSGSRNACSLAVSIAAAAQLAACQPAGTPESEQVAPESSDARPAPSEPRAPAPAAPDSAGHLTGDGWGPLRIGMTRDEVVAALGEDANPDAVGGPDPEKCDEFRPERAPAGMIVMILEGRLARISLVGGSSVTTAEGLGVGDEAAAVRAEYGDAAIVAPHHYVPDPAQYITVRMAGSTSADARGIRYEIGRDGRVTHVHAGGPAIEYVEGCL